MRKGGTQFPSKTFVEGILNRYKMGVVLEGNNVNPVTHVFLGFISQIQDSYF